MPMVFTHASRIVSASSFIALLVSGISSAEIARAQGLGAVRIEAKFEKLEDEEPQGRRERRERRDRDAERDEQWVHRFDVENTSGRDLEGIELRFRVYLYRRLDVDGRPEGDLDWYELKIEVGDLKPREKTGVESEPGRWVTWGRQTPKSSVMGVWVRAYDAGGNLLAELLPPSRIRSRFDWE